MESPGDTVLLSTLLISEAFPHWWTPSPAILASITPSLTHIKVRAVTLDEDGGANLFDALSLWIAVEQIDHETLRGTIEAGGIDRDGFRDGDRIETTVDRVWDFYQEGHDGRPQLNVEKATSMLGKTVLVGITTQARSRRKPPDQSQVFGTIESIEAAYLRLRLRDGSTFDLPPDVRPFENAVPGEYRLRSTGEVVVDPDFTSKWLSTPNWQAL